MRLNYISRLQAFSAQASLKYSADYGWFEAQFISMTRADKLSRRDLADMQRIPPQGTPGFVVFNLRGSYIYSDRLSVNWSAENLFDQDYRVHGSGQNELGRNFLLSLYLSF